MSSLQFRKRAQQRRRWTDKAEAEAEARGREEARLRRTRRRREVVCFWGWPVGHDATADGRRSVCGRCGKSLSTARD